ncbi:hypothetical protein JT358_08670 [Micrococcales bacterium 31B]|nr:hypothetical protein [Micrococcales bacterium 31B]
MTQPLSDWRYFFSGRPWRWFAVTWCAALIVTVLAWSRYLPIPFFGQVEARVAPTWELLGIAMACLIPFAVSGRMAHIDRTSCRDLRVRRALCVVIGVALTVSIPLIAYLVLAALPSSLVLLGPQQVLLNDSFTFTVPFVAAASAASNIALCLGVILCAAGFTSTHMSAGVGIAFFLAAAWTTGERALATYSPFAGGLNGWETTHYTSSLPVLLIGIATFTARTRAT